METFLWRSTALSCVIFITDEILPFSIYKVIWNSQLRFDEDMTTHTTKSLYNKTSILQINLGKRVSIKAERLSYNKVSFPNSC